MGFKLNDHERLLKRFADHLDRSGAEFVTVNAALTWATETTVLSPSTVPAMRMLVVRDFARYLAGTDRGRRSRQPD